MSQASLLSPSPETAEITRESLAAHILAEITRTRGAQLPCYQAGDILSGFIDRFGPDDGMAICNQAFIAHGGMWRSAPVTVMRFQPGQDAYFAVPLLEEARAARR
jgi:hypothetical protein